jgi:hypothetical protein
VKLAKMLQRTCSACQESPREEAAENVEANFEMSADNLDAAADNASTEAGSDALENKAGRPTIRTPTQQTGCNSASQPN